MADFAGRMQFADYRRVREQNRRADASFDAHEEHIRPALAEETFGEHGCGDVVADVHLKSEMFGNRRGQVEIVPSAHRGGADHAVIHHAGGGDSDADDLAVGHAQHLLDKFDDHIHGNE